MEPARAILTMCDENAQMVAFLIQTLSLMDPQRDWYGEVCAEALGWPPFIERGLSIEAWLATIASELI